jgi:hypothetical protein
MIHYIPKSRTLNLAPERSRELSEMMLAALERDDELRWDVLRRRWQGLGDSCAGGAPKRGKNTKGSSLIFCAVRPRAQK